MSLTSTNFPVKILFPEPGSSPANASCSWMRSKDNKKGVSLLFSENPEYKISRMVLLQFELFPYIPWERVKSKEAVISKMDSDLTPNQIQSFVTHAPVSYLELRKRFPLEILGKALPYFDIDSQAHLLKDLTKGVPPEVLDSILELEIFPEVEGVSYLFNQLVRFRPKPFLQNIEKWKVIPILGKNAPIYQRMWARAIPLESLHDNLGESLRNLDVKILCDRSPILAFAHHLGKSKFPKIKDLSLPGLYSLFDHLLKKDKEAANRIAEAIFSKIKSKNDSDLVLADNNSIPEEGRLHLLSLYPRDLDKSFYLFLLHEPKESLARIFSSLTFKNKLPVLESITLLKRLPLEVIRPLYRKLSAKEEVRIRWIKGDFQDQMRKEALEVTEIPFKHALEGCKDPLPFKSGNLPHLQRALSKETLSKIDVNGVLRKEILTKLRFPDTKDFWPLIEKLIPFSIDDTIHEALASYTPLFGREVARLNEELTPRPLKEKALKHLDQIKEQLKPNALIEILNYARGRHFKGKKELTEQVMREDFSRYIQWGAPGMYDYGPDPGVSSSGPYTLHFGLSPFDFLNGLPSTSLPYYTPPLKLIRKMWEEGFKPTKRWRFLAARSYPFALLKNSPLTHQVLEQTSGLLIRDRLYEALPFWFSHPHCKEHLSTIAKELSTRTLISDPSVVMAPLKQAFDRHHLYCYHTLFPDEWKRAFDQEIRLYQELDILEPKDPFYTVYQSNLPLKRKNAFYKRANKLFKPSIDFLFTCDTELPFTIKKDLEKSLYGDPNRFLMKYEKLEETHPIKFLMHPNGVAKRLFTYFNPIELQFIPQNVRDFLPADWLEGMQKPEEPQKVLERFSIRSKRYHNSPHFDKIIHFLEKLTNEEHLYVRNEVHHFVDRLIRFEEKGFSAFKKAGEFVNHHYHLNMIPKDFRAFKRFDFKNPTF